MEFLAAISMLRINNDGETVFSLKSRDSPVQQATVCGANVLGALSPISETSGVVYEPLPTSSVLVGPLQVTST